VSDLGLRLPDQAARSFLLLAEQNGEKSLDADRDTHTRHLLAGSRQRRNQIIVSTTCAD